MQDSILGHCEINKTQQPDWRPLAKTRPWQSSRPQWLSHIIASRTYYNGLYIADEIQELLAFSNQNVKCFDDDCA